MNKIIYLLPLVFILAACGKAEETTTDGVSDQTQRVIHDQTNRTSYLGSEEGKAETQVRIIDEQIEQMQEQRRQAEIVKESYTLAKDCSLNHTKRVLAGEETGTAECSPDDFKEQAAANVEDFTDGSKNDGTTWQPDTFFGPQ